MSLINNRLTWPQGSYRTQTAAISRGRRRRGLGGSRRRAWSGRLKAGRNWLLEVAGWEGGDYGVVERLRETSSCGAVS
jgi:hypothetical protein